MLSEKTNIARSSIIAAEKNIAARKSDEYGRCLKALEDGLDKARGDFDKFKLEADFE